MEVRKRLRRDRQRLQTYYSTYGVPQPSILFLNPSYMCVWLHRWSAYHFQNERRLVARLLWHLNLLLTGADLSVISDIGPGLVIIHPISTQVFGRIGADCTIWGHGGIGGGVSVQDIGAGPGLPIVGDGVTFGARAMALGPVRIGDYCVLEAGVIATRDVPAGSIVSPQLQRTLRGREAH
jgi:serine O-acetyltransferase